VAAGTAPFIVNFKMADTEGDGRISQAEFKQGRKNGWVHETPAAGAEAATGTASPVAPKG
jgi:hypothetical protein